MVDLQGGLAAGGNNTTVSLAETEDAPTLADVDSVMVGCRISSIYLNVQVYATSEASLANVYFYVMKNPGANLNPPAANAVGAADEKKFILHQEMRMMGGATTEIPITMFNGVIRIPRGYQRFGYKDLLQLNINSPGNSIDFCIQCIYKELR